jgi:sugar (pentulose or hexulose) kinase
MKKKIICIIDFGQSHLKFILITQNYRVTRALICKNSFKISYDNSSFYDFLKIKKKIKLNINKISKYYNIIALACVGHGSACFFLDKNNNLKSGFHFLSNFKNKKELNKFLPKFSETFTPNYEKFHNLGKNFFVIKKKNKNFKFMTLTSFIGWLFSKKNIADPSYMSCHTYLWNFRKKSFSSLVKKISDLKTMPKIQKSGNFIGKVNNSFFKINKNCKIYNGMHDTSAAFYFNKLFFNSKNSIFLSTGTTFVFGQFLNKLKKIKEKSNFYLLSPINCKGVILSRRFYGGLIYEKLKNKKKIKSINQLLAIYTIKELSFYLQNITNKNINLIIDGPFSKNNDFLFSLKKLKKNITIYCAKNENSPSLGMAYLCAKKKIKLSKSDYYNKI